ncbi:MAG: OB-fold nucleic acid binding domain-containing protein [Christensenellales bacterium]
MERFPVSILNILENRDEGLSLDGKEVALPCVIQSRKNRTTKTNKLMANLVIEDLYAQMSVMVFPGVLERLNFVLQPDALVLIKGRISIREDEEPTILVDDARIWEPDREQAEEKEKKTSAPPIPGLPSGDELPLYGMENQAQSKQEEPQQTLWLK